MSVPDFLDTNLLVYAYPPADARKQKIARGIVGKALKGEGVVSSQVLAEFAATLKKGAHLQLVGEIRTREYEKEYGSSKKKFTVKQRVCEVALESILKLDRAERQEEPVPEIEPTDDPA